MYNLHFLGSVEFFNNFNRLIFKISCQRIANFK